MKTNFPRQENFILYQNMSMAYIWRHLLITVNVENFVEIKYASMKILYEIVVFADRQYMDSNVPCPIRHGQHRKQACCGKLCPICQGQKSKTAHISGN